jgi:16S rRNA (adenine1518-N6/adenine1519-N6)-dimethyltransferase
MTSPRILLKAWGLGAKKQLGQHFLCDAGMADKIIAAAGIGPEDMVLEIGAGLGALTLPAGRRAARVVAVDLDPELLELLKTELLAAGLDNVELVRQNILRFDIAGLGHGQPRRLIVIGNLPYNISSQVLVQLIRTRSVVRRAVLMFQKELARRICAGPGSKAYGRLSVMLAYCADIQRVATAEARLFFPRPGVDSEVLKITFRDRPAPGTEEEDFFFATVKAAFGRRRKTLKNALAGSALPLTAGQAQQALAAAGIDPVRRAETLTVAEFTALSRALAEITTLPL